MHKASSCSNSIVSFYCKVENTERILPFCTQMQRSIDVWGYIFNVSPVGESMLMKIWYLKLSRNTLTIILEQPVVSSITSRVFPKLLLCASLNSRYWSCCACEGVLQASHYVSGSSIPRYWCNCQNFNRYDHQYASWRKQACICTLYKSES